MSRYRLVFEFDGDTARDEVPTTDEQYVYSLNGAGRQANDEFAYVAGYEGWRLEKVKPADA